MKTIDKLIEASKEIHIITSKKDSDSEHFYAWLCNHIMASNRAKTKLIVNFGNSVSYGNTVFVGDKSLIYEKRYIIFTAERIK